MWVCDKHMKDGLKVLELPHIRKAPTGVTCSFCNEAAAVRMYFAHKPAPRKKKSCGNCVKCTCLVAN
ncbi:hypothetical protein [Bacillus sp. 165]|uniref:hypothetical protein n=1 Tax=Bacillus sp. 165 TaxID=1529117 RepID=UPI001AD9547B|nr:hypothetical protein [Bacillus sp. 165]MBO9130394.1 hypothetical protein [Bacillus sp. 165]